MGSSCRSRAAVHISCIRVSSQPLTTVNSLSSQDSRSHAYRTCRDTIAPLSFSLCVCACMCAHMHSCTHVQKAEVHTRYDPQLFLTLLFEQGLSLNQELTDCLDHLASESWSPPTSGSPTPQYLGFTYVGPGN